MYNETPGLVNSTVIRMNEFEVLGISRITGKGIAVFFVGEPSDLPITVGKTVEVTIIKPDGTKHQFIGAKEYARKVDSKTGEVAALLIQNAKASDIPIGSKVII